MIGIIDYGMGNLFSVHKALERLGAESVISGDPEILAACDGLILPGVGAFRDAMVALYKQELFAFLHDYVAEGKPLLGICLGMQLLFEVGEEHGFTEGLAFLNGTVVKFPEPRQRNEYRVPHMGWNQLRFNQVHPLLENLEEDYVYFVHSYFAQMEDQTEVIAYADYAGVKVPAVVGRGPIMGMQFHPEKSGKLGTELLRNFIRLAEEREIVNER